MPKEIILTSYRRESRTELDSPEIQHALDACRDAGGGRVTLAPGTYRCGTLFMRTGVTLHLEEGAIIMGSASLDDYPLPRVTFVDAVGHIRGRALIMAEDEKNFAITGPGIIDGNGGAFSPADPLHKQRPFLCRLVDSAHLRLDGITLRNAAGWTCHLMNCEDAAIEGIHIDSRVNENNDGIDIDSCRRVTVAGCTVYSDDDAICLKATRPTPCEDIEVRDCVLSTECGALKLGTESYGDIRRVRMHDCRVLYAATGAIKILSADGGVYEDIDIRNIEIERGTGPIFIRLGSRCLTYAKEAARKSPGAIRRVTFANIKARVFEPPKEIAIPGNGTMMPAAAFSGMLFTGIPGHCIEDVTLDGCEIGFAGGFAGDPAALMPPEQPEMYPEHFYFGVLPAAGLYLRHVRGAKLRGLELTVQKPDTRPMIGSEDAERLEEEQ